MWKLLVFISSGEWCYFPIEFVVDTSTVSVAVHQATIFWDGVERDVRVFATGRRPLIGTAILNEQELVIQFTEGGLVTIDEL